MCWTAGKQSGSHPALLCIYILLPVVLEFGAWTMRVVSSELVLFYELRGAVDGDRLLLSRAYSSKNVYPREVVIPCCKLLPYRK